MFTRQGRKEIYTDVREITADNVIEVLQKSFDQFDSSEIDFLFAYEKGEQPILNRTKTYRPDINAKVVDNIASEIVDFKLGFKWSQPITFVQRGDGADIDAVSMLNAQYAAEGNAGKTQQLARDIEICGVGYTYIEPKANWIDGDAYFTKVVLNPNTTFVVKSSYYVDRRPMMGVSFRQTEDGSTYFTCFTDKYRFDVIDLVQVVAGEKKSNWMIPVDGLNRNVLGIIPITEYIRAYDRMGCFERQIDDMNVLNEMWSDMANDVCQNTNSVWFGVDIEFPTDAEGNTVRPASGDWLLAYSAQNGKSPSLDTLSVNYDYPGILNNVLSKRALILQKCGVPQRNDNSGGSTGIASAQCTGYEGAEYDAAKCEEITENCLLQELKVVQRVFRVSPYVEKSNKLLTIKYSDVKPSIKRNKSYEMATKINTIVTGIKAGICGKDMLEVANLFEDNNQVWENSKECVEAIQKKLAEHSTINDKDRIMQDYSDQETNSPNMTSGKNRND